MATFETQNIPRWVQNRILDFLNNARSPEDLAGDGKTDPDNPHDPDNWKGYSIGTTVAERILEKRTALRRSQYNSLAELEGIQGLGEDKFNDLIRVFSVSSAQAFNEGMYDRNIISKENWLLYHKSIFLEDEEYHQTIQNESLFRKKVIDMVVDVCATKSDDSLKCRLVGKTLESAYIDAYTNSTEEAAFALALWFYRFDADNWFSYDRILKETKRYFNYYSGGNWEMGMYFFKGFEHYVLSDGIVPNDLPVVTCETERSITIWSSALYD